jgi:hypothetical protein
MVVPTTATAASVNGGIVSGAVACTTITTTSRAAYAAY